MNKANRVIKFRVWDIKQKRFLIDSNISQNIFICSDGRVARFDGIEERFDVDWDENNYIIQQFTGLKDSYHKDIYEGDLIEFVFPFHNLGIGTVKWFDCECLLEIKHSKPYHSLISLCEDEEFCGKIIGNIFENPELLGN